MTKDWTKFVKRIPVKADAKAIYLAICTPAGFEKWFLRNAIFFDHNEVRRHPNEIIQTGDTYIWNWHGHPDTTKEENKVLEINGKDMIRFGFADNTIVTIQIKNEAEETIVELTQENIKPDEDPKTNLYIGCGEGWTFYLANLKSIMEGGLDLRNKNENVKRVINS